MSDQRDTIAEKIQAAISGGAQGYARGGAVERDTIAEKIEAALHMAEGGQVRRAPIPDRAEAARRELPADTLARLRTTYRTPGTAFTSQNFRDASAVTNLNPDSRPRYAEGGNVKTRAASKVLSKVKRAMGAPNTRRGQALPDNIDEALAAYDARVPGTADAWRDAVRSTHGTKDEHAFFTPPPSEPHMRLYRGDDGSMGRAFSDKLIRDMSSERGGLPGIFMHTHPGQSPLPSPGDYAVETMASNNSYAPTFLSGIESTRDGARRLSLVSRDLASADERRGALDLVRAQLNTQPDLLDRIHITSDAREKVLGNNLPEGVERIRQITGEGLAPMLAEQMLARRRMGQSLYDFPGDSALLYYGQKTMLQPRPFTHPGGAADTLDELNRLIKRRAGYAEGGEVKRGPQRRIPLPNLVDMPKARPWQDRLREDAEGASRFAGNVVGAVVDEAREDPVMFGASMLPFGASAVETWRDGAPSGETLAWDAGFAALPFAKPIGRAALAGAKRVAVPATAAGTAMVAAPSEAEASPLQRIRNAIRAYHGSPHRFDRFDINKIGTGEGAQAYGHGLYFSEAPDVARSYRDKLAYGLRVGDNEIRPSPDDMPLRTAIDQLAVDNYNVPIALDNVKNEIETAATKADRDLWLQARRHILDFSKLGKPEAPGALYTVDLHVPQERLLDWDSAYGEQPTRVRKALDRVYGADRFSATEDKSLGHRYGGLNYNAFAAQHPYQTLDSSTLFSRLQADASKRLLDAGVPGIRYLDQGSRGAGTGTRNYVMFDDAPIEIIERKAEGGAVRADDLGSEIEALLERAGKARPNTITGTAQFDGPEITVPKVWKSAPDHPPTMLAYITPEEAELLSRADLHGSGVSKERHYGPGGVPSFNGNGSTGDGYGGGGDAGPGADGGDGMGAGSQGLSAGANAAAQAEAAAAAAAGYAANGDVGMAEAMGGMADSLGAQAAAEGYGSKGTNTFDASNAWGNTFSDNLAYGGFGVAARGAVNNAINNALSNPITTAINAVVGLTPVGTLNTISGLIGGPTIGSVATAAGRGIGNALGVSGGQSVSNSVGASSVSPGGSYSAADVGGGNDERIMQMINAGLSELAPVS